jgi:hypothetical protein
MVNWRDALCLVAFNIFAVSSASWPGGFDEPSAGAVGTSDTIGLAGPSTIAVAIQTFSDIRS